MLDAIIIEPVLENRTHLRELARDFCRTVSVSSTLQDGAEKIRSLSNCDVIYVSSRFDFEAAKQFAAASKTIEIARDSANLLIGAKDNCDQTFLARLSLNGFDGVLIEPASVETFKVSAEIALKARKEKLKLRTKKSVDLLVRAFAGHIDELCLKKKSGHLFFMVQERLKNLSTEIKNLDVESLSIYFEAMQEYFPNCKPFTTFDANELGSASKRVMMRRLNK